MLGATTKHRIVVALVALLILGAFGFYGAHHTASVAEPKSTTLQKESLPPPLSSSVKVDVEGGIRRPGVYSFPSDARVADAIRMAGGVSPNADLTQINRAAHLVDGTQLLVPIRGKSNQNIDPDYSTASASISTLSRNGGKHPASPISINASNAQQLEQLPGIGPAMASKILAYRKSHGLFQSVDGLRSIRGIGPKKMAKLRPWVRL